MESRESRPLSAALLIGTPITGRDVIAAAMPGRWAAPPAPAMTMPTPRSLAEAMHSQQNAGVRRALITFFSYGTPNSSRISQAADITSQSLFEPIITLTFISTNESTNLQLSETVCKISYRQNIKQIVHNSELSTALRR